MGKDLYAYIPKKHRHIVACIERDIYGVWIYLIDSVCCSSTGCGTIRENNIKEAIQQLNHCYRVVN